MVQLDREGDEYCVIGAAMQEIERTEDAGAYRQNTIAAIRQCFSQSRRITRNVVCGVGGPEVMVRSFSFPNLPSEAVEQAVMLEAQQVCPLDIKTSRVDYQLLDDPQPAPEGESKPRVSRGVLVVATNEAVNFKAELARMASINTVMMDVEGLALLNCIQACEGIAAGQSVAAIQIGFSSTCVAIFGADGTAFVRDLSLGGDEIIGRIATTHGLTKETVDNILRKRYSSAELQDKVGRSLPEAAADLVSDVSETLRYYSLQPGTHPVGKIHLCGGFSLVRELAILMNSRLPERVTILNPFTRLRCRMDRQREEFLKEIGPMMAVATGLAMRTV
jgi:type IV pilus assembly protein PilM